VSSRRCGADDPRCQRANDEAPSQKAHPYLPTGSGIACQFALERAQSRRLVLVDYTKSKTIKELRSAVEKARLDELDKEAAWDSEKAKEIELERQLRLKPN
jgi:hypothetical protein